MLPEEKNSSGGGVSVTINQKYQRKYLAQATTKKKQEQEQQVNKMLNN